MCPACQSRAPQFPIPFPLQTPAPQTIRDLVSFCLAEKKIMTSNRVVTFVLKKD